MQASLSQRRANGELPNFVAIPRSRTTSTASILAADNHEKTKARGTLPEPHINRYHRNSPALVCATAFLTPNAKMNRRNTIPTYSAFSRKAVFQQPGAPRGTPTRDTALLGQVSRREGTRPINNKKASTQDVLGTTETG